MRTTSYNTDVALVTILLIFCKCLGRFSLGRLLTLFLFLFLSQLFFLLLSFLTFDSVFIAPSHLNLPLFFVNAKSVEIQ